MIYFLSDGRGRVKLGRARHTPKRLLNLQTGDADRHVLLALVKLRRPVDEVVMELVFHRAFGRRRCLGGREWYRDCPEIRAWVMALSYGVVCPVELGD